MPQTGQLPSSSQSAAKMTRRHFSVMLDMRGQRIRLADRLDRARDCFAADHFDIAEREQLAHAIAEIGIAARGYLRLADAADWCSAADRAVIGIDRDGDDARVRAFPRHIAVDGGGVALGIDIADLHQNAVVY